jgi:hypothetical protein
MGQVEMEILENRIRELFAQHKTMVGCPIITADFHD